MDKKTRNTKNSILHKALILALINEKGTKTISELAKYLDVTRPTIYGHLELLEKRKLIIRSQNKEKKGAPVTISITPKAEPVSLAILEKTKIMLDNASKTFGN